MKNNIRFGFVVFILTLLTARYGFTQDCIAQTAEAAYLYYYLFDEEADWPNHLGERIVVSGNPDTNNPLSRLCADFKRELRVLEALKREGNSNKHVFKEVMRAYSSFPFAALTPTEKQEAEFIFTYAMLFEPKMQKKALDSLQRLGSKIDSPHTIALLKLLSAKLSLRMKIAPILLQAQNFAAPLRSAAYCLNAETFERLEDFKKAAGAMLQCDQSGGITYLLPNPYLNKVLRIGLYDDRFAQLLHSLTNYFTQAELLAQIKEIRSKIDPNSEKFEAASLIELYLFGKPQEKELLEALKITAKLQAVQRLHHCTSILENWQGSWKNLSISLVEPCLEAARRAENRDSSYRLYEEIERIHTDMLNNNDRAHYALILLDNKQFSRAALQLEKIELASINDEQILSNLSIAIKDNAKKLFDYLHLDEARCLDADAMESTKLKHAKTMLRFARDRQQVSAELLYVLSTAFLLSCDDEALGKSLVQLFLLDSTHYALSVKSTLYNFISSRTHKGILALGESLTGLNAKERKEFFEAFPDFSKRMTLRALAQLELELRQSAELCKIIFELQPEAESSADCMLVLAIFEEKQAKPESALRYLEKIYSDFPKSQIAGSALYFAMRIAKKMKKSEESQRLFKILENSAPWSTWYQLLK